MAENERVDFECDPRLQDCPAYPPVPITAVQHPEVINNVASQDVQTSEVAEVADQIRQLEIEESAGDKTGSEPEINPFENFDFNALLATLLAPPVGDKSSIITIDDDLSPEGLKPIHFSSGSSLGSPGGSSGGVVHNIFNISPVMTNQIGGQIPVEPAQLDIVTNQDPNVAPDVRMVQNGPREDQGSAFDQDADRVHRQVMKLQSEVDELTGLKDSLQFEIQSLRELAENEAKVLEAKVQNSRDRRRS